jgi:hypothetical protein
MTVIDHYVFEGQPILLIERRKYILNLFNFNLVRHSIVHVMNVQFLKVVVFIKGRDEQGLLEEDWLISIPTLA